MAKAKIRSEYRGVVIGFNGSALPLGERTDIDELAIIAQQSGDASLLKLFEGDLPDADTLVKEKVDGQIQKRRQEQKSK